MWFRIDFDIVGNVIVVGFTDKASKILIEGSRNNDVRKRRFVFHTYAIGIKTAEEFVKSIKGKPAPRAALSVNEFFQIVIGVSDKRLILVGNESCGCRMGILRGVVIVLEIEKVGGERNDFVEVTAIIFTEILCKQMDIVVGDIAFTAKPTGTVFKRFGRHAGTVFTGAVSAERANVANFFCARDDTAFKHLFSGNMFQPLDKII